MSKATMPLERPLFFPAGKDNLFGIVTRPAVGAADTGVVLLTGAGYPHSRLYVDFARRLATDGLVALRFDYHGVGESTGVIEQFRLDQPLIEDVRGAIQAIRDEGVSRLVLVGTCFGARTALSAAVLDQVPIEGIAMVSSPVGHITVGQQIEVTLERKGVSGILLERFRSPGTLGRLVRPSAYRRLLKLLRLRVRRILGRGRESLAANAVQEGARAFLREVHNIHARHIPMLIVYGSGDEQYLDFQQVSRREPFKGLLAQSEAIELRLIEGRVHGFPRIEAQEAVIGLIRDWIRRIRHSEETRGDPGLVLEPEPAGRSRPERDEPGIPV